MPEGSKSYSECPKSASRIIVKAPLRLYEQTEVSKNDPKPPKKPLESHGKSQKSWKTARST